MVTEKREFLYLYTRFVPPPSATLITDPLNSNALFMHQSIEDSTRAAGGTSHFATVH